MSFTDDRLRLLANGYLPLPLQGKRPDCRKGWQNGLTLNEGYVRDWERDFPQARETGILARYTPCLDLDVLNEECVEAMEAHVREHWEERGYILPRIGKPPKRAIPFRTNEPFKKIQRTLAAANGVAGQKIEFLADGQQFAALGIHPDTHAPYSWPRGSLLEHQLGDLPYIRQSEAEKLVDELVEIAKGFGYNAPKPRATNGDGTYVPQEYVDLFRGILDGTSLHDSERDLNAKLIASEHDPATRDEEIVRALFELSRAKIDRPTEWHARVLDIRRSRDSARIKYAKPRPAPATPAGASPLSELEFKTFMPLKWIVPDYIPEGCTLLAGKPKVGKSWLMLTTALAVARADLILSQHCDQRRVLYYALEDTERRIHSRVSDLYGAETGWPDNLLMSYALPNIDRGCGAQLEADITAHQPELVIIDTLAMIRGAKRKDEDPYQYDYRTMQVPAEIARQTGVSIIVVHHTRKQGSDDVFDTISGTLGLAAAADTLVVLTFAEGTEQRRLAVRGRDVEPEDKTVEWDKEMHEWIVTGDYEEKPRAGSPLTEQLVAMVMTSTMPVTPKQACDALGLGEDRLNSVQQSLARAAKKGRIKNNGYGGYARV